MKKSWKLSDQSTKITTWQQGHCKERAISHQSVSAIVGSVELLIIHWFDKDVSSKGHHQNSDASSHQCVRECLCGALIIYLQIVNLEMSGSNSWQDSGGESDCHRFPWQFDGWHGNCDRNSTRQDAWLHLNLMAWGKMLAWSRGTLPVSRKVLCSKQWRFKVFFLNLCIYIYIYISIMQWWFNTMCFQLYQVQFPLGTGEHWHSSCCDGAGSQSQVGAQHGSQLPPRRVVVHEDRVKTGPEHPEERRPWRAEAFLVSAMLRCLRCIN